MRILRLREFRFLETFMMNCNNNSLDSGNVDEQSRINRFFSGFDWMAFAICFALAFAVYFYTQAPTVTLEDSGELAVASDYLGVPHPPGYPLWTLLTWLFQLCLHWVSYNGYPNPAWAVGLSSGFFGALACGLLAILISKSGRALLDQRKPVSSLAPRTQRCLCCVTGISAGLLLAFSPVLWSQSTIVEVYSLNALLLLLVIVFLYMWMTVPSDFRWLYAMAFCFGLGLTNHQALMFMGPAVVLAVFLNEVKCLRNILLSLGVSALLMIGFITPFPWIFYAGAVAVALLIKAAPLYRDFLIAGLVMFTLVYTSSWMGAHEHLELNWSEGPRNPGFWMWTGMAVLFPSLIALSRELRRGVAGVVLIAASLIVLRLWLGSSAPESALAFAVWPWFAFGLVLLIPLLINARIRLYALAVLFLLFSVSVQIWAAAAPISDLLINRGFMATGLWIFIFFALAFWLLMFNDIPNGKVVGSTFLLIMLGVSFYLMMPIASEQNPPMNWGYARTWNGFMHSVTRGQYDTIDPIENMGKIIADPIFFMRQNFEVLFNPQGAISLVAQFTAPIAALALLPMLMIKSFSSAGSKWIATVVLALFSTTVLFLVFQYPPLDHPTMFVARVQYIQAHAVYALLIGYGLILAVDSCTARFGARRWIPPVCMAIICLLPAVPLLRNRYDADLLAMAGSASHRKHDFGWQFGYYQLRGAEGILDTLAPHERTNYPNPDYPAPMGPNAVFFGGTDPGRFVMTYMTFSANVRPDVFVITQNALADETYINSLRDLYGDEIWIPSAVDMNDAFRHYVHSIDSGVQRPGGVVDYTDESVSIEGVSSVMQVNSNIARMLFLANRFTQSPELMNMHASGEDLSKLGVQMVEIDGEERPTRNFYVEESYVIPWMYPYLEPHGLIMRLNPKRIELTDEMVRNDYEFWEWYVDHLDSNPYFRRDLVAQKTFSKLRSSISGLLVYHERYEDAMRALQQAKTLYPKSPEANFRLADLFMRQERWEDAIHTIENFISMDPGNERGYMFMESLVEVVELNKYREMLEARVAPAEESSRADDILTLAQVYIALSDFDRFATLIRSALDNENIPASTYLTFANLAGQARDAELFEHAVVRYTERLPDDHVGWINLAAIRNVRGRTEVALENLSQAIKVGGHRARRIIAEDERLQSLRDEEEFKRMMQP